jgi:hypothetical protein
MAEATHLYKKALTRPELAQVCFAVAVLQKYLDNGTTVMRTDTVGRVKAATWSLDFGIAPDEATIHVSLGALASRLPESEQEHWLSHIHDASFSTNFLKMQASHSCIDDGGLRAWGEEESLF